jgi:hypothetical protein
MAFAPRGSTVNTLSPGWNEGSVLNTLRHGTTREGESTSRQVQSKNRQGSTCKAVAAGAGDEVVFNRATLSGTHNVHVMRLQRAGAIPQVLATYTTAELHEKHG